MTRRRAQAKEVAADDSALVAQAVRDDFMALIAIFDRQAADTCNASDISDARMAAERGLRLSEELVELLRRRG